MTLIPDVQLQKARPVTTYAYNLDGTLASETDPLGNSESFGYDNLQRPITDTTPSPTGSGTVTTTTGYDLVGNVISVTSPSPTGSGYVTTTNTYDQANNLESTTDANGDVTTFSHDAVGDTLSLTDSDGNTTSWAYDHDGQTDFAKRDWSPWATSPTAPCKPRWPRATISTTRRESHRHRSTPTSRSINYAYDHLSEEMGETWTDAAGSSVGGVGYSYNPAGYMTSASNAGGERTAS